MWRIVPLKILITLTIALSLTLGGLLYAILPDAVQDAPLLLNYIVRVVESTSTIVILALIIGQWQQGWSVCTLCHRWYPNLSGTWEGTIESNSSSPGTGTLITMRISQTWGSIEVNTTSDAQRSNSKTTTIEAFPEIQHGKPILWIVYEGKVTNPGPSDSPTYFGTSRAEYDQKSGELTVNYWTNRAWNQGKNTAGSITLRKA